MSHSGEPLVSILIPAYNAEKCVALSVQSALAQTWPRKEIILVNDGSEDGTLGILQQFLSKNVQVVSQENLGPAAARNRAYSLCQGDYIQWLDADDLLHPEKINLQMRALDHGATPRTLFTSAWGYFFHRHQKARFRPDNLWCDLTPAEWMMRKMEGNLHMQTATWLVSRELTEAAGPWDTRLFVDDDGEYFSRVMLGCDAIRFVSGAKIYYRRSGPARVSYIGFSNEKKNAQFLSMQMHIQYLLSLANHERSRAACRHYLQTWLPHFVPDRPDLVQKAKHLAEELGGTLQIPRLSWKYSWIQKAFGWHSARKLQLLFPRIKQGLTRSCDKALSYFQ